MSSRNLVELHSGPNALLRHFYCRGGKEIRSLLKASSGKESDRHRTFDEDCSWGYPGECPMSFDGVQSLIDSGFVSARICGSKTICKITQKGLLDLRSRLELDLCRQHGLKSIEGKDVIIDRAIPVNPGMPGQSLRLESPAAYVEKLRLNIWGHLRGSDEPLLLAKVCMHLIDAEAALHLGGYTLADVMQADPQTHQHIKLICNYDLDGEPANHIYELTDMFGLEEAIGRQLIIVNDVRVTPALVGKGVGREIIKHLLVRYGVGGGVSIIPIAPYGVEGDAADRLVLDHLSQVKMGPYIVQHPFVKSALVGDTRKISRLP